MGKSFKILSAICAVFCTVVLTAVAYGTLRIPDRFNVTSTESVLHGMFYDVRFETVGPVVKASSGDSDNVSEEYTVTVVALKIFPVKDARLAVAKRQYVIAGGNIFGVKLYTEGVIVVGLDDVATKSGNVSPAAEAGLKAGDVIVSVNGEKLDSTDEFSRLVEASSGKAMTLSVIREGKKKTLSLTPAVNKSDSKPKAGIWVRDSSAGIGTITFIDPQTGVFGGLGHAVCDVDTGKLMPLSQGEAVEATVNGCYRGSAGHPGELCGTFSKKVMGALLENTQAGIFGTAENPDKTAPTVPVAVKSEVHTGYAQIIATVDENGPQYYDIEITKIYTAGDSGFRNMSVRVTDERLIRLTGGIVQGMSGSPIIQDSMLAGAVTHVFVNDPTQGYAIFAENMLDTARNVADTQNRKNAS